MKFILFFILSFSVHAENWVRHSVLKSGGVEGFSFEKECLRYGEKCYEVGDNSQKSYSEVDIQVDDKSKPVFSKNEIDDCGTKCAADFKKKKCTDLNESPILNIDLQQIYCSKFLSFEKKAEEDMQLDAAKLSQVNADKLSSFVKNAQRQLIAKARECGESSISEMIRLNAIKGLTPGQRKTVLISYDGIKSMLEVGNLDQAITEITALVPDGELVTSSDKAALLAFIAGCK